MNLKGMLGLKRTLGLKGTFGIFKTSGMRKNFFIFSTFIISLAPTACVHYQTQDVVRVLEANERRVADCRLLGQVYGESPYPFLALGLEVAKDEAKKRAAEIGATHIYWTHIDPSFKPVATGRAYRCKHFKFEDS